MSSPDKPLDKYTIPQLKEMLKEAGIPMTGLKLKADFIKKLTERRSQTEPGPSPTPGRTPARGTTPGPSPGASSSKKVDYSAIRKRFLTSMNRGESLSKLTNIFKDLSKEDILKVIQFVDETDGSTLLHWAVRYDRDDAAALLLDHGANIEAVAKDGGTPLHWGAYDKHDGDAVELLIERGANLEARNKEEETPLLVALTKSPKDNKGNYIYKREKDERDNDNLFQFEVAKVLLENGAKALPIKIGRGYKYTNPMLHHFIEYPTLSAYQHNKVAKILIEYDTDKTHLEEIDHKMTPLMRAADQQNIEVIKMLLDKGVDINKTIRKSSSLDSDGSVDSDGSEKRRDYTAYSYAIYRGNVEICKFLLEHGARQTIKYVKELRFTNPYTDKKYEKALVQRLIDAKLLQLPPEQFVLITNPEELKELCEKNKEEDGTYTCAITGEPLTPRESVAIRAKNGVSQCYKKENLLRWINRGTAQTLNPLTNKPFSQNELQKLRQKLTQAIGGKDKKKTSKSVITNTKTKKNVRKGRS